MHIRCPHCHNPVEVADSGNLSDVLCLSCNSSFSLIGGETAPYTPGAVRTIGHFQLLESVGGGYFGTVWKARDIKLDRVVAIKIPRRGQLEGPKAEMFIRDARAAAQVKHPGVVGVHEVGREDGTLYIVSEFIDGCNLKDWLTRRPLTLRESAELCLKLADALHAAHEVGVVHRDLKPGNVMIDISGEPRLIDFGLAKREAGEITMTVDGQVMGTPAYMSPEQARGKSHEADRRSDIYSLGVILFELMTGEVPFRGNQRMMVIQILQDEPPSPRKLQPGIPRDLETICLKCLEKLPYKRYQTAAEVAAELGRYLRGETIYARPVGRPARLWRWCKRNPIILARCITYVSSAIGIIAAAACFWIMAEKKVADQNLITANIAKADALEKKRLAEQQTKIADAAKNYALEKKNLAEQQTKIAIAAKADALAQRQFAEAAKRKEQYNAYFTRISLASAKIEENAFDRAAQLLNDCPPELKNNWEWRRLNFLCTQGSHDLSTSDPIEAVALSPDGKKIASGGLGGTVRIWNTDSVRKTELGKTPTDAIEIPSGGDYVFALAFSPNGDLAVGHNGMYEKHDQNSATPDIPYIKIYTSYGKLKQSLHGHTDAVLSLQFSTDGHRLLSGSYDRSARIWDVDTGKNIVQLRGHDGWVNSAAYSSDEKRVVTASQDGSVSVWGDISSPAPSPTLTFLGHKGPVYTARFRPGSIVGEPCDSWIASAGYDKRILLWESKASGDKVKSTFKASFYGHTSGIRALEFSADGERLISASNDNTLRIWNVSERQLVKTLRGHGGPVRSIAMVDLSKSSDRRSNDTKIDKELLISGSLDRRIKFWNLQSYGDVLKFGDDAEIVGSHAEAVLGASLSPDSQSILSASRDRTVKLWDVTSGKVLSTFGQGQQYLATAAAFFPGDNKFVTSAADSTTHIWDVLTGMQVGPTLERTGVHATVAISPDDRHIATGSERHTAIVWDISGRKVSETPEHRDAAVTAVAFSHDGRLLFTGDNNGRCYLWNATTMTPEWSGPKLIHTRGVTAACFLPGDQRILTASADRTVIQWDPKRADEIAGLTLAHAGPVTSLALSGDGHRALTTCDDGKAHLWDVDKAVEIVSFGHKNEVMRAATFSSDGLWAVTTSLTATFDADAANGERTRGKNETAKFSRETGTTRSWFRLWNLSSHSLSGGDEMRPVAVHEFDESAAASTTIFTSDCKALLAAIGNEARMFSFYGKLLQSNEPSMTFVPQSAVTAAHFSPDGKRFVTAGYRGARIWNIDKRLAKKELALGGSVGHVGIVNDAVFSPDHEFPDESGHYVATAGLDGQALLWNATSGALMGRFSGRDGHRGSIWTVNFSPDGKRLATASQDGTVKIWDVQTQKMLLTLEPSKVGTDAAGNKQGLVFQVSCAVFSPDGNHILSAGEDNRATLWAINWNAVDGTITGKPVLVLEGHTGAITSAAISPNGKRAVTGSRDNTAKLWEIDVEKDMAMRNPDDTAIISGKELLTFKGHTQAVTAVAFSKETANPDQPASVLTAGLDGTIVLWPADHFDPRREKTDLPAFSRNVPSVMGLQ